MITLPDVEGIVIEFLETHFDVDAMVNGRVYADIPEGATYPFVTINRIGGRPRPRPHWIERAHLEIAGWSEGSRSEARDICATAMAALHELPGVTSAGVVTGVEDVLGPRPLYDPETSKPRFLGEVLITAHPLVEAS